LTTGIPVVFLSYPLNEMEVMARTNTGGKSFVRLAVESQSILEEKTQ